jgi:hypothetical protein
MLRRAEVVQEETLALSGRPKMAPDDDRSSRKSCRPGTNRASRRDARNR